MRTCGGDCWARAVPWRKLARAVGRWLSITTRRIQELGAIRGKCAQFPPKFQGKDSCLVATLSASNGEGGKGTDRFATCQTHKATFFSQNSPQIRDDSLQFASF